MDKLKWLLERFLFVRQWVVQIHSGSFRVHLPRLVRSHMLHGVQTFGFLLLTFITFMAKGR